MRRSLGTINLILATVLNIIYARNVIKKELKRIAEKEWQKPHEFVAIMFARGKYNNLSGLRTAVNDYKFAETIAGYYEKTSTDRNVKSKKFPKTA